MKVWLCETRLSLIVSLDQDYTRTRKPGNEPTMTMVIHFKDVIAHAQLP